MKALYSNIKALRIAKGWSQEELALRLGYKDRSMLAKIEAGKVDITVGKVEAFADACRPGGRWCWMTSNGICNSCASVIHRIQPYKSK